MNILAFKLGLNTTEFSAGGKLAINGLVKIRQAAAAVGRFARIPIKIAVTGADVLWKLPDQLNAIKGLASGLALPVKLAASAETTATGFRVLVGDVEKANEALEDITRLAASTPFEFPELAASARSLVAFGEDSRNVANVLRRIGDVAAGVNTPIGELATLYGKARVAGVLMTEDINQLLERGIPILQEFAKQTGRSAGEVKEMASQGAITFPMLEQAFTSLTTGAGKFAGMMEQSSTTMEGRLSNLGDSFKSVMTAVGDGLNAALKPLVSDTASRIDGLKENAKALGEELGRAVDMGVVVAQSGELGDLLLEALKAGGLFLADQFLKAAMWGAQYLGTQITKAMPSVLTGDDEVRSAGKKADRLVRQGLDAPGLGNSYLSGASRAASDNFNDRFSRIKAEAASKKQTRDEEAAARENDLANNKRAAKQADDAAAMGGAMRAFMDKWKGERQAKKDNAIAEQAYQNGVRVGLKPAELKKMREDLGLAPIQGPAPAAAATAPGVPLPATGDAATYPAAAMAGAGGTGGRRTIKGAGYNPLRNSGGDMDDLSGDPTARRTIKGAGYKPKTGGDQRGGLATSGQRRDQAGAAEKSAQIAAAAAQIVIQHLPVIADKITKLEAA